MFHNSQHESEMQEHERIYLNLKNDMNRLTLGNLTKINIP